MREAFYDMLACLCKNESNNRKGEKNVNKWLHFKAMKRKETPLL